jgi:hypothetical protein
MRHNWRVVEVFEGLGQGPTLAVRKSSCVGPLPFAMRNSG